MIRAKLRLARQILIAVILCGLLLCGAEVGVRVYEVTQGKPVCSVNPTDCPTDPTRLTVPSWLTNLELRPHATAEVKCKDSKRTIEVRTNSLGFRGPDVAIPKPRGTYRIVILGDETILAPETADEDHFVQLLSNQLSRLAGQPIEIVNAGVPGACPLTEFLLFKQKLLSLQPDLVLLHFDWSDVADDRQLRGRMRCDPHGTPISCPHVSLQEMARPANSLDQLRQQFRLIDWGLVAAGNKWKQQINEQAASSRDLGMNAYAWLRREHPETDVTVTHSFRPIGDLAKISQGASFQLSVVTSPKPWQVSARCTNGAGVRLKSGVSAEAYYPNRAPFDALAAFADEARLPYADLSEALINHDGAETNYLRYAPRWSPTGHSRVAEYLARFLSVRIPGPWNGRYPQQDDRPISQDRAPRNEIQWAGGTQ